jgi:hypothetical protein
VAVLHDCEDMVREVLLPNDATIHLQVLLAPNRERERARESLPPRVPDARPAGPSQAPLPTLPSS